MIELEHLTKRYGSHLALSDLSVTIEGGQIYGFLGPNGAGKSTTMNIMTGCLAASGGRVRIGGYDVFDQPERAKRLLGYLPERPPLYLNETPLEYLRFVGQAKGVARTALSRQIQEALSRTGLEAAAHRRIAALSKGYQQRLGIAQALLGSPEVIILDEPTVGLDPIQIIEIRKLVKELGQTHTVIFSSHILSEVQAICGKILIISQGRLAAFGTPEELESQLRTAGEILLTTDAAFPEVQALLAPLPHITDILPPETAPGGGVTVRLKIDTEDLHAAARSVFLAFSQAGQVLWELSLRKVSLEDVFLELTEAQGRSALADTGQDAGAWREEASSQTPPDETEAAV